MDATVEKLLDRFAQHARRSMADEIDWELFDALVGHVLVSGQQIAPETIAALLGERGWMEDQAARVAEAYGHQVRILTQARGMTAGS